MCRDRGRIAASRHRHITAVVLDVHRRWAVPARSNFIRRGTSSRVCSGVAVTAFKIEVRRGACGMDRFGAQQFEARAAENFDDGVAIIPVFHADADTHEGQSCRGVVVGIGP